MKILWKSGEIAQFLLFSTIFCYLLLDFHVKTETRVSLRDKRIFEISEVEITRVDCSFCLSLRNSLSAETFSSFVLWLWFIASRAVICLTLGTLGKIFSRWQIEIFFLFFQKTFLTLCKFSPLETICMKCQILFSWKPKKKKSIYHLLN